MGSAWPVGDFGNLWNDDLAARHRGAGYSPAITGTPVDLYVYDTSQDSDGGAWRKRCQHTSWYNETLNTATRGSRREFPAVAVIVAEADKVTIYDGDDPSLPMWMVFDAQTTVWDTTAVFISVASGGSSPVSSVAMKNGNLVVGGSVGVAIVNFIDETQINRGRPSISSTPLVHKNSGTIALRNNPIGQTATGQGGVIVNRVVNDVAMTVLPDAPIDPATGLQVPTIAVATDGGVSVIKDDGTVVDVTHSSHGIISKVSFLASGGLSYSTDNTTNGRYQHVDNTLPNADVAKGVGYVGSDSSEMYHCIPASTYTGETGKYSINNSAGGLQFAGDEMVVGGKSGSIGGLAKVLRSPSNPTAKAIAEITSTYNTGWMNGDIKGAFLSDTDDTDLVAGNLLTAGQVAFTSGWQFYNGAAVTSTGISDPDGGTNAVEITSSGSGGYFFAGGTADRQYYRKFWVKGTGTVTLGSVTIPQTIVLTGTWTLIEDTQATSAGTARILQIQNVDVGDTLQIYAPYVDYADADRSVNNSGLIVNGTVTRTPVATGADLVAYSGFSASNYLEQPYNSDLDFGTGDFCVMGWVKEEAGTLKYILDRSKSDGTERYSLRVNNTLDFSGVVSGSVVVGSNTGWHFVAAVRRSGVVYLYVDGEADGSGADTADYTSASATLKVGTRYDNIQSIDALALLRISATAPTAEQIAKIYEDEKVLFQEGAQATLYGSSDAVTALAHDDSTQMLHVGTSAGRSVFQGLRRVSNTTTAVGTAISAANNLIVEE